MNYLNRLPVTYLNRKRDKRKNTKVSRAKTSTKLLTM